MSDTNSNTLPLWQRVLNNQRFQMFLGNAIKASGVAALPFVKKWFPDLSAESITGAIIMGVPFFAGLVLDWYRNHPDNILARAQKVINGGTASPAAVAKVEDAIATGPALKS